MNTEEFSQICNSSVGENGLVMSSFLKEGVNQAITWLSENAFSLFDLPSVIAAYSLLLE